MFGVNGQNLSRQYKAYISNFHQWQQEHKAEEYVLYKENLGSRISMDETCLSQGELYTIVTNKDAKGGKGALIAMMRGTKADTIIGYLKELPTIYRLSVKEITIDLSPSMKRIASEAFPNASIVADRFHVQKLMNEAVSDLRVNYRWEAIDKENREIKLSKDKGVKFNPEIFANGDTLRQLLARSRHIVMKHFSKWTPTQKERADILFEQYPTIKKAYDVSMQLTQIFNSANSKGVALTKIALWYESVEALNEKYFNSVIQTMQNNYGIICNYFDNRSTNASAESFNAKIKAFRSQFRGVRDIPFFIFRLSKLFA